MPADWQLRRDICDIGRRIYDHGFVAATDGNLSVRVMGDRMFITPSGSSLGELRPADLVYMDFDRRILAGPRNPSSELALHVAVYRARPDVAAVVHAHPPTVNAFSFAGVSLADCVIPEVVVSLGSIPTTDYGTPSTDEGPRVIESLIRDHDAIVLQRHGSLTVGPTLLEAYRKLENLEHSAQVLLAARQLGGVKPLSEDELRRLGELRERFGLGSADSIFRACPPRHP